MAARRQSGPSGAHVSPRIKVSVDPERRAAWARAAKKAGVSLVAWLRAAGDERAGYAQNVCENGDHPAPPGKRFCSKACERADAAPAKKSTCTPK